MEHDIKLTTDTPVCVKQYPLPYSMMQAVGDGNRMFREPILFSSDYCKEKRQYKPVLVLISEY